MKPVTVWEKFDLETNAWKHNHIQDEHVNTDKSKGTEKQEKAWEKSVWKKEHMYLNQGNGNITLYKENGIKDGTI